MGAKLVCSVCMETFPENDDTLDDLLFCPKCGGRLDEYSEDHEVDKDSNRNDRNETNEPLEEWEKVCSQCGKKAGLVSSLTFHEVHGKNMCSKCSGKYINDGIKNIIVTTTHTVDGYRIISYIGIESVEIVIGTGIFAEFSGSISDFFGVRSTGFEQKLASAKETALKKLKLIAFEKGANAVIGIDLDFTEFSGNRIGLIINGTLVSLQPREK